MVPYYNKPQGNMHINLGVHFSKCPGDVSEINVRVCKY